ncbi:uncharacterized protein Z520_08294 [Fonsecaea multimorphosa CBS 102226]|uniref:Uncharacterized protein n=1 Tax=Fonsecaea multimorphosa CBS 102226 TaxID=1442371 RepID=A0A0D2JZL2_9EURO|nr:uncharacterized protein Z520_08294 [Fonsecaea multimorphosa CBS 102226]KIX96039.1 hypothetical protein Z520_08294 [Fonsecaea multimorphosa CBS 102226]OAL21807.1 hypothetical protein AYO22_07749 [Fonsecaea multimorphosa]
MSSEQRYDVSFTQLLLQDELPTLDMFRLPSPGLPGDSTMASDTVDSSYGSQENGQANSQQGGQPFNHDLFSLPSSSLVGDTTMASVSSDYYNFLENGQAGLQRGGQCFYDPVAPEQNHLFDMTWPIAGNFSLDPFAIPQSSAQSAFAPLDYAAAFETAGKSDFDVGNLDSLQDMQTFNNTAGNCHLSEIEAIPTSELDGGLASSTPWHTPQIPPIDVSFFLNRR